MMHNHDPRLPPTDTAANDGQRLETLEALTRRLADNDRRKDEFLALLGHELRNPLAPIHNAIQILKLEQPAPGSRLPWACAVIERQLGHIARLVDDLLDVARINRGRLELQKKRSNLVAILQQAVESVRPLIEQRRHRLDMQLPDETLEVDADTTRLIQVIANLLTNAAKYTGEGGTLTLTLQREGQQAVLTVRDSGIGIPADRLATIFELFAQLDSHLHQSQGGLGLGLPLVRRLVELHGGSVEAFSAGPNQGSEFTVRLPLVAAAQAAAPRQHRILVVDDQMDVALALSMLLETLGHEVDTASNGPAALHTAAVFQPDVVIIDLGLPQMNGFEVARRLRQSQTAAPLRLIAMTGYSQDEDTDERIQAAGFDSRLLKPIDLAELQAALT